MTELEFNTHPTQHYTTAIAPSEVNRDDRPNTPVQVSEFTLGNKPGNVYYSDPQNTPLPSPIIPLLVGILIIYLHKVSKKIPPILAHLKKKH